MKIEEISPNDSQKETNRQNYLDLQNELKKIKARFSSQNFDKLQEDYHKSLRIPENIFPEFTQIQNFNDLLFFIFINQISIYFLLNRRGNPTNKFETEKIEQKIGFYVEKYHLNLVFSPPILVEMHNRDEKIVEEMFTLLNTIEFQNLLTIDTFGSILQNILCDSARKRFAANYTDLKPSILLAELSIEPEMKKLIDPFGGSGRLLFDSLNILNLSEDIQENIDKLYLNEIFLPAIQLFYLKLLINIIQRGNTELSLLGNVNVSLGDAFHNFNNSTLPFLGKNPNTNLSTFNLVIMNPPFTRQGLLGKDYRTFLAQRFIQYKTYLNKHMGLHGYALFLAHELLAPGGIIAAVLPASTIISGYGEGLKKFLLQNYHIVLILTSAVTKAFSEGSDFREIILICQKKTKDSKNLEDSKDLITKFVLIKKNLFDLNIPQVAAQIRAMKGQDETDDFKVISYPKKTLESKRNWLYFFEDPDFQQLYDHLKTIGHFISSNQAGLRLVRGFEMYGPNYFLLPNKEWKITQDQQAFIEITNNKDETQRLQIPRVFLKQSLRKPEECQPQISFEADHYALAVPEGMELPPPLKVYYEWGLKHEIPALKRFGKKWFSHVHAQLESKQPFGRVFVADKFSVNALHNFAYYFPDKITCTKNFYVFQGPDAIADRFLAAWLNSTVFLFLFLAERREIGGSYGRLQIADYKSMPLFIKIEPQKPAFEKVLASFRDLQTVVPLPLIQEQFAIAARQMLDDAILSYLGILPKDIPALRELIYSAVIQKLKTLEARD